MPTERIIHGERDDDGHWSAWFADAPSVSFGGRTPVQVLIRLFATSSPPCTMGDILAAIWSDESAYGAFRDFDRFDFVSRL